MPLAELVRDARICFISNNSSSDNNWELVVFTPAPSVSASQILAWVQFPWQQRSLGAIMGSGMGRHTHLYSLASSLPPPSSIFSPSPDNFCLQILNLVSSYLEESKLCCMNTLPDSVALNLTWQAIMLRLLREYPGIYAAPTSSEMLSPEAGLASRPLLAQCR